MNVRLNLMHRYGYGKTIKEVYYYKTIEDLKKEMAYVEYGDELYEWQWYDRKIGPYDVDATFTRTNSIPKGIIPYKLPPAYGNIYRSKVCECGSHKLKSNLHSHWCPLYEK